MAASLKEYVDSIQIYPPILSTFIYIFTCTPYIFYLLYKIHVYPPKKNTPHSRILFKIVKVPEVIPQLSFPGTYLVYIIINCTSKIIPTLLVIITCTKWKYTYIHIPRWNQVLENVPRPAWILTDAIPRGLHSPNTTKKFWKKSYT